MSKLPHSIAILLCAFLGFTISAVKAEEFGVFHALLIANQTYQEWDELRTPHNDAKRLERVLKEKYGFVVKTLRDATREQIIDALEEYRESLGSKDNLLIFYAGHGQYLAGLGYWIGVDGDKSRRTKWVSGYSLTPLLSEITSNHILVVADSCYAGAVFRENRVIRQKVDKEDELAWIRNILSSRSRTALVSGTLEPVIDHIPNASNSLFAEAFIGALEQNTEIVDGNSIFESIKKRVVGSAERYLPYNVDIQVPSYDAIRGADHQKGDFLFVPLEQKEKYKKPHKVISDAQGYGLRGNNEEDVAIQKAGKLNTSVKNSDDYQVNPMFERVSKIVDNGFLVKEDILFRLDGGGHEILESPSMSKGNTPKIAVIHYTAGPSKLSASKYFTSKDASGSAHVIIARDGSTTQFVPFDQGSWHAGRSQYRLTSGKVLRGMNKSSIGISLVNYGKLTKKGDGWYSWSGTRIPDDEVFQASNVTDNNKAWHAYTPEQIDVTTRLLRVLKNEYSISEITGHEDIAPGRKSDPGPAFPMQLIRERVFKGG